MTQGIRNVCQSVFLRILGARRAERGVSWEKEGEQTDMDDFRIDLGKSAMIFTRHTT